MSIKIRSRLRFVLGRFFYTYKRYLTWYLSKTKFAKEISNEYLLFEIFSHKSILMRQLKNVDMYLQENKKTNLKIAAAKINGLIIRPGETFSFWKLVGKTDRKSGYLEGLALSNGKITKDIGGGLCQLANLIYWMTIHTPLKVTERWRHGYDVFPDVSRTQPFGSGATVAYNYVDLQVYNPTSETFQLLVNLDDTFLKGQWRSEAEIPFTYKIIEKNHGIHSQNWGGYTRHNEIYREIMDKSGKVIDTEFVAENDAVMMYNPLLEGVKK